MGYIHMPDFMAGKPILLTSMAEQRLDWWSVWNDYVSYLPHKSQLEFVQGCVAELAERFASTGEMPSPFIMFAKSRSGESRQLRFHVIGEISDKLIALADLLADPRYASGFYVKSAEIADHNPEDVALGRVIPTQPGFMLYYSGLPVLMFAAGQDGLYLKMKGFDRSFVFVPKDMPGLFERLRHVVGKSFEKFRHRDGRKKVSGTEADRRQKAAQRRLKARERQEANGPIGRLGLTLPATTFFVPATVNADDPFASLDEVLLVPLRGSKDTAGAYHPRKIIENMRGALGVQVILADYKLRALLRDGKKAREILAKALPKAVANLRENGLKRLADLTEFDTVEQVKRWADVKFPDTPSRRVQSHATEIKDILRPAQLLLKALTHAERVVAAFDRAENEPEELATSVMEQALRASSSADLPLEDLCDIARYGDINPVSLWQVNHEQYALVFEALRVMGKIQAGTHAVLPPHLQPIFLALLNPFGRSLDWAQEGESISDLIDDKVRAVARATAELLAPANMAEILAGAAGSGQKLVIERRSRKVSLQPMDGNEPANDLKRIYNPLKPRGFMVSIVPRKPEQ